MNIALIGLGMVAQTHVAAIRASDMQLTLRGVLGRDGARAQAFASRNDTQRYASLDELAADSALDFVILATPPDARQPIVERLIAARLPVLMEKPIERDLNAARTLVQTCARAHVPLGLVLQHRARDSSQRLKTMITEGVLGEIATADLRVPWWRDQSYYDAPGRGTYARDGGGVMISQAIHTLDLAIWLLGPVRSVQAMLRQTPLHKLEAEDWASALLDWHSGAIGTLTATTAAYPGDAESLTIQGTKAAAHLQSGVLTITPMNEPPQSYGAIGGTGGGADPMAFTHAWHQTMIEDFAQSLADNRTPLATGQSALQAHAVIDAMERASASGTRTEVPQ